jgi:hypothetical protein
LQEIVKRKGTSQRRAYRIPVEKLTPFTRHLIEYGKQFIKYDVIFLVKIVVLHECNRNFTLIASGIRNDTPKKADKEQLEDDNTMSEEDCKTLDDLDDELRIKLEGMLKTVRI